MLMIASNQSYGNGRLLASQYIGMTLSGHPASETRRAFAVGSIQRSAAVTYTPYSFARNMELSDLPHPRSRTRIPSTISSFSHNHSVSQSGFGPIECMMSQDRSYPADRG